MKECIAIKGVYSTGGLACRLHHKMEKDSLTVELLKKAGAIPLCTGNTIQIMVSCLISINVWLSDTRASITDKHSLYIYLDAM